MNVMMILREELYSISSNTQSRKMPLPSRSDRTFLFDVPKDPISDGGNRQSDQLQENPMKKRSIESCTGRLHGERLNVFQLTSLTESQQIIDGWHLDSMTSHPHSSLGRLPLSELVSRLPAEPNHANTISSC